LAYLIEEPYLLATHGVTYERYAAATGRFVPGVGRPETADAVTARR
jgi:protein-S-isoprenylcysteine O-methyltransferase Ste14